MIVTTTPNIAGRPIADYHGIVVGDPAEFLMDGFLPDTSIFAAGRFEDWPANWTRSGA